MWFSSGCGKWSYASSVFSFCHVTADIESCSDCALICLFLIFRDDCLWHGQRSSASALSEFGWCQQWPAIWLCCSCHFTVSGCLAVCACVVLFSYCCNLQPHRCACSVLFTAPSLSDLLTEKGGILAGWTKCYTSHPKYDYILFFAFAK